MLQLLLLSGYLYISSTTVTVYIDADTGNNTGDCYTTSSPHHPCQTFKYAVTHTNHDTTFLLLSDLTLETVVTLTSLHNITITGGEDGQQKQLVCNCNYTGCGLVFDECEGITLERVTVKNCSFLLNYTISQGISKYPMRIGVIIKNGTGSTTLSHFVTTDNEGYGMMIKNMGGAVNIFNSNFTNNALHLPNNGLTRGGGGLYIIINCNKKMSNCLSQNAQYKIINSTFSGNKAKYKKHLIHLLSASYGGGLNIFLGLNAVNIKFSIQNCAFRQNNALSGGGLFFSCESGCVNNTIKIYNSLLRGNHLTETSSGGGGGAIGFTSKNLNFPSNNTVDLHKCTFTKNSAQSGGGTLVYASKLFDNFNKSRDTNRVNFKNCSWIGNNGSISPAVDLAPDYKFQDESNFIVKVTFNDCIFKNNYITTSKYVTISASDQKKIFSHYHNTPVLIQQYHHCGVFLVTKLHVHFTGTNSFINNTGSALYLCSSRAKFSEDSVTHFINNTGMHGGAMSLIGFSSIQYQNDTAFHFMGNSAKLGGAIYVHSIDQHLAFASYTCFLIHGHTSKGLNLQNPRNITFSFVANKASYNLSHSLYLSSSVHACKSACSVLLRDPNITAQQVFGNGSCLGNFTYDDSDSTHQVAADGSIIALAEQSNNFSLPSYFTITPGIHYYLPVDVYDSFGNNVTSISIYSATLNECENASIDPAFTDSPMNYIKILGQPRVNCILTLTINGILETQVELNISLTWCRPGYVIDHNTPNAQGRCVCSASLGKDHHYYGISRCNSSTQSAIIDPGVWVGYDDTSTPTQKNLYTATCPSKYCNYSDGLELNVSATFLTDYICSKNRQEFVCGKCQKNTSVFFNNLYYICKNNSKCHLGALFYLTLELLPISIVFIIIILTDISLTSGVAYSTVFVMQMMYSISFTVNEAIPFEEFKFIDYMYGIVDLDFKYYPYCLWAGCTTLDVLVMKYVSMAYAMGLVICTILMVNYCNCGRLRRLLICRRDRRYSIVQGLSTLMVICYSRCTHITFKILSWSTASGIGSQTTKNVVYYTGHIEYFSSRHLPYAIPAVLILTFIVVPLPLVLFFDPFLLKMEGVLVQHGILKSCLPWTRFRMKFKPFFDSFQGCFRDDARYFAGLFFIYRTVVHLMSAVLQTEITFYMSIEAILAVILTIQAVIQPLEKKWHNIISSVLLFAFLLVNSISISNYILFTAGNFQRNKILLLQLLQMIPVLAPLMVTLAVCGKWLLRKIVKRKHASSNDEQEFLWERDLNHYGSNN